MYWKTYLSDQTNTQSVISLKRRMQWEVINSSP